MTELKAKLPLSIPADVTRNGAATYFRHFITWLPVPVVILAALLWAKSLENVDPAAMTDIGLLSVLHPLYFVALGLLTVSACLTIYFQKLPAWVFALHVVVLILMLHATPPLVYGTLRYSWAWKHLGIIDYIQRHGTVDPTISSLPAYHNWPGFFTLSLLLTEAAGLPSPLVFAPWAQVFHHLIFFGAVTLIYRAFTGDRRLIQLAVWFFYPANWVGQDYFAPQATAYFLHLVILGICLMWFRLKNPPSRALIRRFVRVGFVTRLIDWGLQFVHRSDAPETPSNALQRAGLFVLILLFFIAIASSHQLTPFMTISAVSALVVLQRCSIRSLPVLLGMIAVIWIVFFAVAFLHPTVESIIEGFGQMTSNAKFVNVAEVSAGQKLVVTMGRLLTVAMLGLAGTGVLRMLWYRQVNLPAIGLMVASFGMMAVNSYGGEMIFRAYLFALPFAAFLAAALIYPVKPLPRYAWILPILSIGLSAALLGSFLFAYYGKEQQFYFSKDEIAATDYLYSIAPPNTLLIEGARNYPSQYRNYEQFTYVAIAREPREALVRMINDPVERLSDWMDNSRYAAVYLLFTRSQIAEIDTLGTLPNDGKLADIVDAISASPRFQVIYENKDAKIFVAVNSDE